MWGTSKNIFSLIQLFSLIHEGYFSYYNENKSRFALKRVLLDLKIDISLENMVMACSYQLRHILHAMIYLGYV